MICETSKDKFSELGFEIEIKNRKHIVDNFDSAPPMIVVQVLTRIRIRNVAFYAKKMDLQKFNYTLLPSAEFNSFSRRNRTNGIF